MNATVAAFPRKKKPGAKKRRGPMASIVSIVRGPMPHWSGYDEYIFDHLLSEGQTREKAAQYIEQRIADQKVADGMSEHDGVLYRARQAIRRMKRRQSK